MNDEAYLLLLHVLLLNFIFVETGKMMTHDDMTLQKCGMSMEVSDNPLALLHKNEWAEALHSRERAFLGLCEGKP